MSERRHVPFPKAGPGYRLRFTLDSWCNCYRALKADSFQAAIAKIATFDPLVLPTALAFSLRDPDDQPAKGYDFNDPMFSIDEAVRGVIDAAYLLNHGKTLAELEAEANSSIDANASGDDEP
ncbi:MAG: hypothetical protein AB7F96_04310 [Beijerinckiaceae bacterium]